MSEGLTARDIEILKQPFDEKTIGIKIQSFSKNKDRAMLVAYVQHTDVYDRLESVDPSWSCHVASAKEVGQIVAVSMQMTVKGVTRENVGEGEDYKSAYSDALKRVAMLFGIGRYLYDQGQAWVPYNDSQDKYRVWTLLDFQKALQGDKLPSTPGKSPAPPPSPKPTPTPTKNELAKQIFAVAEQLKLSQADLKKWVLEDFKKPTEKLTTDEMVQLLKILENELGRTGEIA
jgi:hypothetical protein